METSKDIGETKTKSIFALDSDDENHTEGDSGLAGSLETSPKEGNSKVDLGNDFEPEESLDQASQESLVKSDTSSPDNETKLSAFQKARIERNRQRALLLRQARLQAHPYKK